MKKRHILFTDIGQLLRRGKLPHEARKEWRGPLYLRRNKWRRDLLSVTGQLAAIVHTNSPMMGGLDAAALDAPSARLRSIFLALRDDIASGLTVAQAMGKRPRFFPRYCADLVRAGEETGKLYEALCELTEDLMRGASLKDHVAGWAIYGVSVATIQCAIVLFFCIRVAPVFVEMFRELGTEVPRPLLALQEVGLHLSRWQNWVIALLILCLAILMPRLTKRKVCSTLASSLFLYVPFLRSIFIKLNLMGVSQVMEKLLAGRVPLDEALEDAASVDINPSYATVLRRLKERVQNGETLSAAMKRQRLLPSSFRTMVSVGESSGLLPEAFKRIGGLYQREGMKTTKILIDIVAPLGVVALGSFTLFVTLAAFSGFVGMINTMLASI